MCKSMTTAQTDEMTMKICTRRIGVAPVNWGDDTLKENNSEHICQHNCWWMCSE